MGNKLDWTKTKYRADQKKLKQKSLSLSDEEEKTKKDRAARWLAKADNKKK